MSQAKKGKPSYIRTPEMRKNASDFQKGKSISDKTKDKMSLSHFGITHSLESKAKISRSKTGKHFFNNGSITVLRENCPDGFIVGKKPRTK